MAKKKPVKKDRYILKKFVFAKSAREALSMDKKAPVVDVYVDVDYIKQQKEQMASAIGFDDGHRPGPPEIEGEDEEA